MIGRVSMWIVCGALLTAGVGASKANAQFMSGGGYGLGFFNYGGNTGLNYERIPYYALYPPVYYSYPVARTYGYSPFAYPPGVRTPEAPKVQSAVYLNPFVKPSAEPASDKTDKSDKAVRRDKPFGKTNRVRVAKTYINPFVEQAGNASKQVLTARAQR